MKKTAQASQKSELGSCLEEMEALNREIEMAISAIAANRLPALEESLRKQGEQAARCEAVLLRSAPFSLGDARMRNAAKRLQTATEKYAAVLLHAGQSLEMLSALHQTQAGAGGMRFGVERRCLSWQG